MMVKQSLDALVNSDTALARQVRTEDDEVDQARQRIRDQIMSAIRKHPERVERRKYCPHCDTHRVHKESK